MFVKILWKQKLPKEILSQIPLVSSLSVDWEKASESLLWNKLAKYHVQNTLKIIHYLNFEHNYLDFFAFF